MSGEDAGGIDNYTLVLWPESQTYMEAELVSLPTTIQSIPQAYFISIHQMDKEIIARLEYFEETIAGEVEIWQDPVTG